MADEIILPEAVTKDMLQALFTEAYMDVSLDSDGDIVVKQSYRCYVVPATDGRFIRLYSLFKPNPDATAENKLAFVNRVNDGRRVGGATAVPDGDGPAADMPPPTPHRLPSQ